MKRLIILVILVMILVGLLGIADSSPLIADTSVPDSEITNSTNHSATLTITMITPPLPDK